MCRARARSRGLLIIPKEMFLLDSGAQFRDGTLTDITRTMKFSAPSDFEREAFTRVLCGHISLAQAVFPAGTVGPTLDAFARQSLWSAGLDYVHGTGHGVGAFLNVHEGPIGISSSGRSHSALTTPLQAGMVLSNGQRMQRSATARSATPRLRAVEAGAGGSEAAVAVSRSGSAADVLCLSDARLFPLRVR